MISGSRLNDFVFGRLPSFLIAALFFVWSTAGAVGLRNALMGGLIALALADGLIHKRLCPDFPRWLFVFIIIFILQTTLSLAFSFDFNYSKQRWWADYAAPLLLVLVAGQFARGLDLRWIFGAVFAGLLINGVADLRQVIIFPDDASQWKGLFSDYGWENGYLLLTLPFGFFLFKSDPRIFPAALTRVLLAAIFLLAVLAAFSSWARANVLCFLAVYFLVTGAWLAHTPDLISRIREIIAIFILFFIAVLAHGFLPSGAKLGSLTHFQIVFMICLLPLMTLLVPGVFRKRFLPWFYGIGGLVILLSLWGLYQFGGLSKSHSEMVRRFSYSEFMQTWEHSPVLGFGPGRDIVFMKLKDWPARQDEYLLRHGIHVPTGSQMGHTHIQWINWRFELGYTGLLMISFLISYAAFIFIRQLLSGTYDSVGLALGGAVLAFSLISFSGLLFTAGLAQQFWLTWGLFVANRSGKAIKRG